MNKREAIKKTLALHQMVVDGKYVNYITAKRDEAKKGCYLCQAAGFNANGLPNCSRCDWVTREGAECAYDPNGEDYHNSPQSITRLNRWLADPRIEKS